MKYIVVAEPTTEPVSLAEVKLFLRLLPDDTSEDDFISGLIAAAREYCENFWLPRQLCYIWIQYQAKSKYQCHHCNQLIKSRSLMQIKSLMG